MKNLKNNPLSPLVLLTIIAFAGVLIVYFLTRSDLIDSMPKNEFLTTQIDTYKDHLGQEHTKVSGLKKNDKSQFYQAEIAALTKQLGAKEKDIEAITDLKGRLVDSLELAKLEIDAANSKVWNWEKKYKSGSNIVAKMSEKDSVLQLTNIDIKVQVADTYKKRLFKADQYSVDFFSPDQNILFDGARIYRKETLIKKRRFGIGLNAGYGLSDDFKIKPYFGLGFSYNLITF